MQISMFDGRQRYFINKPIRLIELFAGIGAQAKALERLGVEFEHYRVCEFDKYAMQSYNAIHGTNFETSDIREIKAKDLGIEKTENYCYILTYSFPCQDISVAGNQGGFGKGYNTRSGLLWEVERLLDECETLPQILLMENVPPIISEANGNMKNFGKWIEKLEKLGYKNYWELLNAKDFGIPQSRNRCFMVSILGDYYYEFPNRMRLELKLKDLLERNVDKKYILSEKLKKCFSKKPQYRQADVNEIARCITTREGRRPEGTFFLWDGYNQCIKNNNRIGTLTSNAGADCTRNRWGIIEPILVGGVGEKKSNRGTQYYMQDKVYSSESISITVATCDNPYYEITSNQIRRLTPRECFRLMGFDDIDFEKAKASGVSETQLYKQAGNSIVVNVLVEIFKKLFKN